MTVSGKHLKKFLYPLLAIGLIYWVYQTIQPDKIIEEIKGANYFWVGVAALAGLTSHVIRALRWKLLIEPLGYKSNFSSSFHSVMVGYTVNYVTPRMGEVARCAIKAKSDDIPIDKLVGTVVTERVFDLIIMFFITIAGVFWQYDLIADFLKSIFYSAGSDNLNYKVYVLIGLGVLGILGIVVYRYFARRKNNPVIITKIIDFVTGLIGGAKSIFQMKRPILFIIYSLLIWLMYFLVSYLVFFALDGTRGLGLDAAMTTLIVATFAVIVPAPGGLGSFHYFVPRGLLLYGIDLSIGTSYAIISHASQMLMIFFFGGLSMVIVSFKKRKSVV